MDNNKTLIVLMVFSILAIFSFLVLVLTTLEYKKTLDSCEDHLDQYCPYYCAMNQSFRVGYLDKTGHENTTNTIVLNISIPIMLETL